MACKVGFQPDPEATHAELPWVNLGLKPSPSSLPQSSQGKKQSHPHVAVNCHGAVGPFPGPTLTGA